MNKYKTKMKSILFIFLLVIVAIWVGIYMERYRNESASSKSTKDMIAVVNMDEGTVKDGEIVNYASKLIQYPDVNFVSSNITEAKEGIKTDYYGGYVIIPNNFSESIESINDKPQKSNITYQINPNLREDIKIKVMSDITRFIEDIEMNVSYMYVDAILEEFHNVQAGATTIMENDKADMERLLDVNPDEIMEPLEFTEPSQEVDVVETIDLSLQFENAKKNVNEISNKYTSYIKQGAEEFAGIKEKETSVIQAMETMQSVIESIDIEKDIDNNLVYQEGITKLEEYQKNFEDEFQIKKEEAKNTLDTKPIEDSIEKIKTTNNTKLDELKTTIEEAITKLETDGTITADVAANLKDKLAGIEEIKNTVETECSNTSTQINTLSQNSLNAIENIPTVSVEEVQKVVNENIIAAIETECLSETEKIQTARTTTNETTADYMALLQGYDPLKYVNQGEINQILSNLEQEVNTIEREMNEKGREYEEYAYDVYSNTRQDMENLRENLNQAYEQTNQKIVQIMLYTQKSKKEVSAYNEKLLLEFTEKLPYTHLGSMEYTEVYDFMVNPIERQEQK